MIGDTLSIAGLFSRLLMSLVVILLLLLLVTVAEITLPPNCDNVSLTLFVVLCTIDTRTVTLITPIMITGCKSASLESQQPKTYLDIPM